MMNSKLGKLWLGLGVSAIALLALQRCDAGNWFVMKCWCDNDRCHTPDCRELDRKAPPCDCRFGYHETVWTPWAANCPQPGCNNDGYAPTYAPASVESQSAYPEPSYQPGRVPPYVDPSSQFLLPPTEDAPLPPARNDPFQGPAGQFELPVPGPTPGHQPSNVGVPFTPRVPSLKKDPGPVPPQPQPPSFAPQKQEQIPMPPEFQAPSRSGVPAESVFMRHPGNLQQTAHSQPRKVESERWRVMPGYQGAQQQEPVMSQPFFEPQNR